MMWVSGIIQMVHHMYLMTDNTFSRLIFIDLQQSTEALDTSHDGKISRLVPAKGLTDVRRSLL